MENGEVVVSMTPPSSPPPSSMRSVSSHNSSSIIASTSNIRNKKNPMAGSQDSPMDLSLRNIPKLSKSYSKDSHSSDHSQSEYSFSFSFYFNSFYFFFVKSAIDSSQVVDCTETISNKRKSSQKIDSKTRNSTLFCFFFSCFVPKNQMVN